MLENKSLEERLIALEQTVSELKHRVEELEREKNGFDALIGSISDEEAFLQALEYGRSFHYSDAPV